MASPASPAETRAYIIERLVGDTGEPDDLLDAARSLAERALPGFADALGAVFGPAMIFEVGEVELRRFAAAKPGRSAGHALAIAPSASSPDALLMVLDPAAAAIAVSALFGGDPDLPVAPLERDLSAIEAQVADILFREVAAAVAACGPATLAVRPPPAALTGVELTKQILRDGPAVAVSITINLPAASGSLRLCIPQRLLLKKHSGAPAADKNSAAWGARFGEEVMRSAVTLEATMPLKRMTLADLAELRVGEVIELSETAQTEAKLGARGQTLFVCEFGKLGQNYTVRVRHPFDAGQEFIEGLLPA